MHTGGIAHCCAKRKVSRSGRHDLKDPDYERYCCKLMVWANFVELLLIMRRTLTENE